MFLLEFILFISLSARLVSSASVCQPNKVCQLNNNTLRCSNLTSSQSLFIKYCSNLTIKSLDLSRNNISRIVETYQEKEDTFPTEIKDKENKWYEVQISTHLLAHLEEIDLSHNQFHSFPWELANSQALKVLNLAFNKINKMNNTLKMNALMSLNLQNNEIEKLEDNSFYNYPNLMELDLSGNKLKTLNHLKLQDVKVLNVSNNLIHNIEANTFKNSTKIEILDLSNNLQTRIAKPIFEGVQSSLRQLNLSNNKLTKIFSDAFSDIEQLEKLSLSENPTMKNINHIIFPYHLKVLELNNNSLQVLDECLFQHLKDIQHLNLGGNPLFCNCHIYRIFASFGSKLYMNKNSTCRSIDNPNVKVKIKNLNQECFAHNCRLHDKFSEMSYRLNITFSIIDTLIQIKWRSSFNTQRFLLQIKDSSNEQILFKYINYDREYEFESSSSFMSYNVCIAAVNEHKEIIQQVCHAVFLSDKNIIIGISAGVIALLPCVILLIYIVCKDRKYTTKLLIEDPEDKVPIVYQKAHPNGVKQEKHNKGFEHEDPSYIPETIPQAIPLTNENLQKEKSQSSSTHL